MEQVGRVRRPAQTRKRRQRGHGHQRPTGAQRGQRPAQSEPTSGSVDGWAGLVRKGKQVLPLARHLCSNRHPHRLSQHRVEEAVLAQAVALLARVALAAIVVGDRGLGRKERLLRLATRGQDFVCRRDPDLTADTPPAPEGALLATLLAAARWLGRVVWDRGQDGVLPCRARAVTATSRFSRSGRVADVPEATLPCLELGPLVPLAGSPDPLVLATTLPVATLADAIGVARVYAWRWARETGFDTRNAWGLARFLVRSWIAIERRLWLVALADALLVLALRAGPLTLTLLHEQATALLRCLSVCRHHRTVGKLAEAIGLDYQRHRRAWTHCWLI